MSPSLEDDAPPRLTTVKGRVEWASGVARVAARDSVEADDEASRLLRCLDPAARVGASESDLALVAEMCAAGVTTRD